MGHLDVAAHLLDHGASATLSDASGLTSLMELALGANDADPRLIAQNGDTALSLAKRSSLFANHAIADLLESASAGAPSAQELS